MINNSFFSILDRILYAGLKFLVIVLLGHWLGSSGQGTFSLYLVVWAWVGTFSSLGLVISNNYYGAKGTSPKKISLLLGNTIVFGFCSGMLAVVVIWILAINSNVFRGLPPNKLHILLIGVLLYSLYMPLLGLLVGLEEFKLKMISSLVIFAFFLLLIFWQRQTAVLSSSKLGLDWLLATGLGMSIWCWKLLKRSDFQIGFDKDLLRKQIVYGIKTYRYSITNSTLARVDVLIISNILGTDATGVYSVALYFAEVLMYFPAAFTTVLLASVGSGRQIQKEFYRNISTFFLMAILVSALIIPILVPIFFPPEYLISVVLAEIMLLGVYWLGMGSIGSYHILGNEKFSVPFYASLVAVIVEISLAFILVLPFGLIGVAIASMVAYINFGVIVFYSIARDYQCSIKDMLFPNNPMKLMKDLIAYYGNKNH